MRRVKDVFGGAFMAIPTVLGFLAVLKETWWILAVAVVLVFFCVGINPLCRELESIWVFVMSFFTLIPATIYFLLKVFVLSAWAELLQYLLFLFLAMSVEVLLMVVVSVVLWPVRKKRRG